MSWLSSLKKKITLKSVVKFVEGGGPISTAVKVAEGKSLTSIAKDEFGNYVAHLEVGAGAAAAVGGGAALSSLGASLWSAAKGVASAEVERLKKAATGAVSSAEQDLADLAKRVAAGGDTAAAAISSSSPVQPAGLAPSNTQGLVIAAVVLVLLLLLFRGKK